MLESLALPIVLSAVALFFASFLSWMVIGLHWKDWKGVPQEKELMDYLRSRNLPVGNYHFPHATCNKDMSEPSFQEKLKAGPIGLLNIMPPANMGKMLGLTVLYFLAVSFGLAYLGTIAIKPGAAFLEVFRFFFTGGFMVFVGAIVAHSIWFKMRIVGHVIESLAYAAIVGAIFASMWPKV